LAQPVSLRLLTSKVQGRFQASSCRTSAVIIFAESCFS